MTLEKSTDGRRSLLRRLGPVSRPLAKRRLWLAVTRHLRTGGRLTYEDFVTLARRAEADIREASAPVVGSGKCAGCGRKMRTVYTVAGSQYGEKCALRARRNLDAG